MGSHKDRGMAVAVARARQQGCSTVIAASSGNAGAAAAGYAAYAARAGLRCVVLTTTRIPRALHALLSSLGAILVAYDDRDIRHEMLNAAVDNLGWAPGTSTDLAIGGTPFGNEAYKSVAYECAQQFGDDLAAIVLPTCRADLLSGLGRGYRELAQAGHIRLRPRHGAPAFSPGNEYAHRQGLNELWASAAVVVAATRDTGGPVRALSTSSGMKDPELALQVAASQRLYPRASTISPATYIGRHPQPYPAMTGTTRTNQREQSRTRQ
ncbi:MAG: pyridoxal-phosphate dependent enzyme [Stackebrandtia sp.]